jgi:inorganic pyrophosphatase
MPGRLLSIRMASDLLRLAPRDEAGDLRVVVESPRGSRAKLKWDPALGVFTLSRPLPLGFVYPFDWGFVPGTHAADGDPLDAMILSAAGTHPGVVVPCRPLAVLCVEQNAKEGGRQRNDRLIVVPVADEAAPGDVPPRVRTELETFFGAVAKLARKDVAILGWGSVRDAEALVERSRGRS